MVENKNIAWHAGNWTANMHDIGIEHEGYAIKAGSWYTEPQYESSAALVKFLAAKYGVPLDREHIVGHDEVPGQLDDKVAGMHWDAGPYWDWNHYMSLLGAPTGAGGAGGPLKAGQLVRVVPPFTTANQPTLTYGGASSRSPRARRTSCTSTPRRPPRRRRSPTRTSRPTSGPRDRTGATRSSRAAPTSSPRPRTTGRRSGTAGRRRGSATRAASTPLRSPEGPWSSPWPGRRSTAAPSRRRRPTPAPASPRRRTTRRTCPSTRSRAARRTPRPATRSWATTSSAPRRCGWSARRTPTSRSATTTGSPG
ncbi:N-acetylmuramoyl-L-alanine amidase [Streptomyces zhihengii]